ncbi:YihY/virulence factor BrkB family protein [Paramicrobacterium chengjingii]|uniref:YihY/virulence factor BrkB family protein n=1 Tax=Paramicrobacterium chengjingii TaxID=2769067 RepID=A0ABX6YKY0_9MICO|nr:YihY/virulence factor BrkB family protein [Microbacterium chengjingii]QPZ39000.1 YihY/virulence factor BrkB family protein [Microbacterium chengjingii]
MSESSREAHARPTRLRFRSIRVAYVHAVQMFGVNKSADVAATLTYFLVLALFPGLIAIVSILSLVNADGSVSTGLIQMLNDVAPKETAKTLEGPITTVMSSPGAGLGLVLGLLGAIWSASKYVDGFTRAANRAFGVTEGRPALKLRATVLLLTASSLVAITVMAILLIVSAPVARLIGSVIGLGDASVAAWNIAKWPVLVLAAIALIALLYYFSPNVKPSKFRFVGLGAITALLVWAITTVGFVLYVSNSGGYNATYGSLGGIIVFLIWLYLSNMALVFGIGVEAELERARQLQQGIHAEYSLQLPLRDVTMIDKKIEAEAKAVISARKLRRSFDG